MISELRKLARELSKFIDEVERVVDKIIREEVCRNCRNYSYCFPFPINVNPTCRKYNIIKTYLINYVLSKKVEELK